MFYSELYHPSWNSVDLKSFNTTSLHAWVYLLIIFCSLVGILLRTIRLPVKGEFSRRTIIRNFTVCGFLILVVFQIYSQEVFLEFWKMSFDGKTIEQKYLKYFGESYAYSQFVLQNFPGECVGKLITDFDPTASREPSVLKYFLFPRINIIDQRDLLTCLVVFEKTDPDSFVPKDFKIIGRFSEKSLFAIRKK